VGTRVFEVEEDAAGVVYDLFPELVGVGGLVLIAEDVENFRAVTGFDVTIARIGLQVQIHALTRLAIFYSKLPFHLPPSHPRKSNRESC